MEKVLCFCECFDSKVLVNLGNRTEDRSTELHTTLDYASAIVAYDPLGCLDCEVLSCWTGDIL